MGISTAREAKIIRGGPLDILGEGVSDPKKIFMQEIELEKKILHALEERKLHEVY